MNPVVIKENAARSRRKRSNGNGRYLFDPDETVHAELTWPTNSGTTESEANQICRDAIMNSPAFQKCYDLFGDLIFHPVKSCVEDIKVSIHTTHHTGTKMSSAKYLSFHMLFKILITSFF